MIDFGYGRFQIFGIIDEVEDDYITVLNLKIKVTKDLSKLKGEEVVIYGEITKEGLKILNMIRVEKLKGDK